MGTVFQIQNTGESCFSQPLILKLNAHMSWQIDETQQEWVQLTMYGDDL